MADAQDAQDMAIFLSGWFAGCLLKDHPFVEAKICRMMAETASFDVILKSGIQLHVQITGRPGTNKGAHHGG